ncbi:MAG: ATP-grasp domain-containing protein [Pseudomonadota bacterium]
MSHWLIVAGSARALARACVDAGWRCDVIDPFADSDIAPLARRLVRGTLSGDHFDERLPALVRSMAGDWRGIVAGSGFEAVPSMLDKLAAIAPLYGNDAATVARCKAPLDLAAKAHRAGVRCAEVDVSGPVAGDDWLMKPIGGCGGIGVRAARAGEAIAEGWFAQRRIDGVPASVLFLADGHDARLVGVTRQYPGSVAGPYAWCEAVGDLPLSAAQYARLARDVAALTQQFGLRGLNGADLVFDGEHAVLIEINPRPTATMMLYEQRVAGGLFAAHVAACEGRLDEVGLLAGDEVHGLRVVYAPDTLRIGDDAAWPAWSADRPPAGNTTARAMPLCTVLATGRDGADVSRLLRQRERQLLDTPGLFAGQMTTTALS